MSNVVQPQDSWSNFASNPASFLEKLRKSGEPVLLRVEGQGEVVVQDAAAFRRDQKKLDRLETILAAQGRLARHCGRSDIACGAGVGEHRPQVQFAPRRGRVAIVLRRGHYHPSLMGCGRNCREDRQDCSKSSRQLAPPPDGESAIAERQCRLLSSRGRGGRIRKGVAGNAV